MKFVHKIENLKPALVIIAFAFISVASICQAQNEDHKFTFNGGGGVSPLVGAISERLDNGWH